jgi:hypothetical protein
MMRIVLIFLLLCTPALAHDPSHPERMVQQTRIRLRTLVLCVEQVLLPSVRSPEFSGKPPPRGSRFHRVARNDFVPYGVALRTF